MHFLIFFGNILKNLVVVYEATLAKALYHDLAFSCKMMRKWYFWYCSSFFVCCIYLDRVTRCLCKFMFLHYAPSKSSHLGHHGSWNTFQAVTQQPTGIWPIVMYSQKAHSPPNMTILFWGSLLHSSTRWEEFLSCHLLQPDIPIPLPCQPSSLSLFQQIIFSFLQEPVYWHSTFYTRISKNEMVRHNGKFLFITLRM